MDSVMARKVLVGAEGLAWSALGCFALSWAMGAALQASMLALAALMLCCALAARRLRRHPLWGPEMPAGRAGRAGRAGQYAASSVRGKYVGYRRVP